MEIISQINIVIIATLIKAAGNDNIKVRYLTSLKPAIENKEPIIIVGIRDTRNIRTKAIRKIYL